MTIRKCPRCATALVEQARMHVCMQCTGQWVDMERLDQMAADMHAVPRPAKLPFDADPRPRIPCLVCNVDMDPWRVHGVPIDRCIKHGVWFDRDELRQVLAGGVDPPKPRSLARVPLSGEPTASSGGGEVAMGLLELVIDALFEIV
jgi:Zn-finger nucleic acid-binding protein